MDNLKLFLNVKLSMDMCNHYPPIMHIIHESCTVSMNNAVCYPRITLFIEFDKKSEQKQEKVECLNAKQVSENLITFGTVFFSKVRHVDCSFACQNLTKASYLYNSIFCDIELIKQVNLLNLNKTATKYIKDSHLQVTSMETRLKY